ncbi:MAG: glycogen debranching enzyme family protein [Chloroflexi bacterium]|nr:glycogen debranching enzyme family protein [Ktedonobacteraceae bacterium]MBV9706969.1 glycogen debranching enzyme family protein [Chloroflexota bacterium]
MIQDKETEPSHLSSPNAWHLQVGRAICSDIQAGLNHEWLVTNGLGGYASASLLGATTRSYHGMLVAALRPPVERTVLVTKIDEEVTLPNEQSFRLGVNEYRDGTIDPQGYHYLESVSLEGDVACFTYRLTEALTLEKRIWMEYGQNITYVQYIFHGVLPAENSNAPITLSLSPFCLTRDYHGVTHGAPDWHFLVDQQDNRCRVRAYESAPSFQLVAEPHASFSATGLWYWHVRHRRESERGLPDDEDVYQPGVFRITVFPGASTTFVLSAEAELNSELGSAHHEEMVSQAYMRHQLRIKQLLTAAEHSNNDLQSRDPVRARLVVAADQFIVARPDYSLSVQQPLQLSPDRKTIIAGYHWFTDWGRDSMISLPGLFLSTGRYSEARGLLKAFSSYMHNGLIPNRFPDNNASPEYNTVDATLWMFHAIDQYLEATGDWTLLKDLFPILQDSIQWHINGTDYGIGVDSADGLLHAEAPGVQLTWMDAKVGDWVVTPRRGKPVEINALWYRALTLMESWAIRLSTDAILYSQLRTQVRQHFAERFWYQAGSYLYDVIDVEGVAAQNDASLRPNQLLAASLTNELLSEAQITQMLQQVTEHLLTPMGLRSLAPSDPAYKNHFNEDARQRDSAYHQGTVWPWLIGPYVDVHLRVRNDRTALLPLLQPLIHHLWETCLGTVSEVAEPETPFTPAGCVAQAWSVAELLRCWLLAKSS